MHWKPHLFSGISDYFRLYLTETLTSLVRNTWWLYNHDIRFVTVWVHNDFHWWLSLQCGDLRYHSDPHIQSHNTPFPRKCTFWNFNLNCRLGPHILFACPLNQPYSHSAYGKVGMEISAVPLVSVPQLVITIILNSFFEVLKNAG